MRPSGSSTSVLTFSLHCWVKGFIFTSPRRFKTFELLIHNFHTHTHHRAPGNLFASLSPSFVLLSHTFTFTTVAHCTGRKIVILSTGLTHAYTHPLLSWYHVQQTPGYSSVETTNLTHVDVKYNEVREAPRGSHVNEGRGICHTNVSSR